MEDIWKDEEDAFREDGGAFERELLGDDFDPEAGVEDSRDGFERELLSDDAFRRAEKTAKGAEDPRDGFEPELLGEDAFRRAEKTQGAEDPRDAFERELLGEDAFLARRDGFAEREARDEFEKALLEEDDAPGFGVEREDPVLTSAPWKTPERMALERLAADMGMTAEDLLDATGRSMERRKAEERAANLMEQGFDKGMSEHIAGIEVENRRLRGEIAGGAPAELQRRAREKLYTQRDQFFGSYPEAAAAAVTEEEMRDVQSGASPMEAYQRRRIREMQKKVELLERRQANRRISTGRVQSAADAQDEFVRELLKD